MKKCKKIKHIITRSGNFEIIRYYIEAENEYINTLHNFQGPAKIVINIKNGYLSDLSYFIYGELRSKTGIRFIQFFDNGKVNAAGWGYRYKKHNSLYVSCTKWYWDDESIRTVDIYKQSRQIIREYNKGKHFDNISKYVKEAKKWVLEETKELRFLR